MVYSLSKYVLTMSIPESVAQHFGTNTLSIGGTGSYTDSITIRQTNNQFEVEGDATGSHVINKSNNRVGEAEVVINQMSERVAKFIALCNVYYSSETIDEGVTLELRALTGETVATCNDCFPNKPADQAFGQTAQTQSWVFVCGEVTFH